MVAQVCGWMVLHLKKKDTGGKTFRKVLMKRPIFFLESTVSGRKDEGEFTNLRSFVVMVVYFHTRELNLYTLGLQKHHPGRKTIFQIVKSTGIPEPGNFSCVCLHTAWRLVWQPAFRSVCSLISQLPLTWSTKLHLRTTLIFFSSLLSKLKGWVCKQKSTAPFSTGLWFSHIFTGVTGLCETDGQMQPPWASLGQPRL